MSYRHSVIPHSSSLKYIYNLSHATGSAILLTVCSPRSAHPVRSTRPELLHQMGRLLLRSRGGMRRLFLGKGARPGCFQCSLHRAGGAGCPLSPAAPLVLRADRRALQDNLQSQYPEGNGLPQSLRSYHQRLLPQPPSLAALFDLQEEMRQRLRLRFRLQDQTHKAREYPRAVRSPQAG